jgi:hypothetical protein
MIIDLINRQKDGDAKDKARERLVDIIRRAREKRQFGKEEMAEINQLYCDLEDGACKVD